MTSIEFRVFGLPAPQGSKRSLGNGIMIESSKKVRPWRTDVQQASRVAYQGKPIDEPVGIEVDFYFPRPKGHYRTGKYSGLLKPSAPTWAVAHTNGDLDKLLRSTCDALSFSSGGCIIRDDSLVGAIKATKRYADDDARPGAAIRVALLNLEC